MNLKAYCDGSCYYKTKQGGAGVYITCGDKEWFISEGYCPTTISRMEMMAVLKAIEFTETGRIDVYSDSEYVVKSFTEGRLKKWAVSNFIGIKNSDLWLKIIDSLNKRPELNFNIHHIRGHQKDLTNDHAFGNSVADILANYKNFKIYKKDL